MTKTNVFVCVDAFTFVAGIYTQNAVGQNRQHKVILENRIGTGYFSQTRSDVNQG